MPPLPQVWICNTSSLAAVAAVATPHGRDIPPLVAVVQVAKWSVAMALIGANTPSRSVLAALKQ